MQLDFVELFQVSSHLFLLSQQVVGINGIMAAYATALHSVSLHGPTLFGPVINRAANIASESVYSRNKYFVLLIITVSPRAPCESSFLIHLPFLSSFLQWIASPIGRSY